MTDDEQRRADYDKACAFAGDLAKRFLQKLEPIDAAGALIATGVNVLVAGMTKATAVAYLRELADELERDSDPATTVN